MAELIRISDKEIVDVVKFSKDKVILVEKNPSLDSSYNVNYFVLNFSNGNKEIITKDAYLLKKYGPNRRQISEKLGNFVLPHSYIMPDRRVLVIYPNGETGLFDREGNLVKNGSLTYNDSGVSSIGEDGEYFWSACKDENCVIRYNNDGAKMDLRIGGREQSTFIKPSFVSADKDYVYVCCENDRVRKINKVDFTTTDVKHHQRNVNGYYKFGKYAIITTSNGAFCEKDE